MLHRVILSLLLCAQVTHVPLLAMEETEQARQERLREEQERIERERRAEEERRAKEARTEEERRAQEEEQRRQQEIAEQTAAKRKAQEEEAQRQKNEQKGKRPEVIAKENAEIRYGIDNQFQKAYDNNKPTSATKPLDAKQLDAFIATVGGTLDSYQKLLINEWENFTGFESAGEIKEKWKGLDKNIQDDIQNCIDFINDAQYQATLLAQIQTKDEAALSKAKNQASQIIAKLKEYHPEGLAKWLDQNVKDFTDINTKVSMFKYMRDFLPDKTVSYALQLKSVLDSNLSDLSKKGILQTSSSEKALQSKLQNDAIENYERLIGLATIDLGNDTGKPQKGKSFTPQDLKDYQKQHFDLSTNVMEKAWAKLKKKFSADTFNEYRRTVGKALSVQTIIGDPSNIGRIITAVVPIAEQVVFSDAAGLASEDRETARKFLRVWERIGDLSTNVPKREELANQQAKIRRTPPMSEFEVTGKSYQEVGNEMKTAYEYHKTELDKYLEQLKNSANMTPEKKAELTQNANYQAYLVDRSLNLAKQSYTEAAKFKNLEGQKAELTKAATEMSTIRSNFQTAKGDYEQYKSYFSEALKNKNEFTKLYDANTDELAKQGEIDLNTVYSSIKETLGIQTYPLPVETKVEAKKTDIVSIIKMVGICIPTLIALFDLFKNIMEEIAREEALYS